MKQITLVLHYDDDGLAQSVFDSMRQIQRKEPDQSIAVFGSEIRHLEINGPNDQPPKKNCRCLNG